MSPLESKTFSLKNEQEQNGEKKKSNFTPRVPEQALFGGSGYPCFCKTMKTMFSNVLICSCQ